MTSNSAEPDSNTDTDTDTAARAELRAKAGETEDYVGVPISDSELGEAWESKPADAAESGSGASRTSARSDE